MPNKDFLNLNMDESSNKFIIAARIAVALRNKSGSFSTHVTLNEHGFAMFVHFGVAQDVVEHLISGDVSEQDLLNWWSEIEKDSE